MNIFERIFRRRIKYAHPHSKLKIADYKIPFALWSYYYLPNPLYLFKTEFEHDVDKMLSCKLDRFNVDFMNNKLLSIYEKSMADINEQYIYRKKMALALKTNRKTYIKMMNERISLLEKQNQLIEEQLKEYGVTL